MNESNNNPRDNVLKAGVTEDAIKEAINKSGYPLQTIIAEKLSSSFRTQQEWSYIDKETNELRTLDIEAERLLFDFTEKQPRVRPTLNLLIECKQSDLPYIFYLNTNTTRLFSYNFPMIAGLFEDKICISSDDTNSTTTLPIFSLLELDKHEFISKDPNFCLSFSKCVRRSKDLELSGTEAYCGLILPLLKAVESFKKTQLPPKTAWYFDAHLVVPVGVLDAPMIGVSVKESGNELIYLPWIRVLRHETDNTQLWVDREKMYAIDIVHKDFFNIYIEQHLLPFAEKFSSLVLKHQNVIASGKGFAKGMDKCWHFNIESRLEDKPLLLKKNHFKIFFKNIINNIKDMKEATKK